jgi:nicotinamide mononucleotide transporter
MSNACCGMISTLASQMTLIEVLASILTLGSVALTVLLRTSLYPVGIAATILFFFVFLRAHLYSSAGLQVYFTLIQLYGWWFWRRGDSGRPPKIGDWSWRIICGLAMLAGVFTIAVAWALDRFTDAQSPLGDTSIFALSVLAQFLLDRKQLKNWFIWGAVDILSIVVYATQALWFTAGVYILLLINVAFGLSSWRRAQQAQEPALGYDPT